MTSAFDGVGSRDADLREDVPVQSKAKFERAAAPKWLSSHLGQYWQEHPEDTPVPAGAVVRHALIDHPDRIGSYLDVPLDPGALTELGPRRSPRQHLELVRERWDPENSPVITARRAVLGLALDADLGRGLLETGAIESLVRLWSPLARPGTDPTLLPWDMLSDRGRADAEAQPLLAAALGAPSEWNGGKGIALPGPASALAFSQSGDRMAALCGTDVYRVTRQGVVDRLGTAPPDTRALGWGRAGVVTLSLGPEGELALRELSSGEVLLTRTRVTGAALSGDGSTVWFGEDRDMGALRVGETSPVMLGLPADPVAVDHGGRTVVAETAGHQVVLSLDRSPAASGATTSAFLGTDSPATLVAEVMADPPGSPPVLAVGRVAGRFGRARPAPEGGVVVELLSETSVARLATGPGAVTALASGPAGMLAVASDHALRVWSPATTPVVEVRPQYAPDRAAGPQDLLDADREARPLAALVASADLKPPLAVGLFGAWGSGKSFLLERIKAFIGTFTEAGPSEGYLEHVPVVTFNAWHYAETNLWAALVSEVLLAIRKECSPAWEADEKVRAAEQKLAEARLEVWRRRRMGLLAAAAIAAILVLAVVAVVLWHTAVGRWAAVLGAAGVVLAVVDYTPKAASWLKDVGPLVRAVAETWQAGRRLAGARLDAAVARQRQPDEVRKAEELGGTIRKLAEEREYRDLLGLVTRTRERFEKLDESVRASRRLREEAAAASSAMDATTGAAVEAGGSPPANATGAAGETEARTPPLSLDRVVIMIDDLDRCPPQKVVTVLEAVHLLFDFELFVVFLAVDTRWLEQSLRIRYRKLLGAKQGAAPSDYLEKIIQVPFQVTPLDDQHVRRMLTGLTGASMPSTAGPIIGPRLPDHGPQMPATSHDERGQREGKAPRQQRSLAQVLQITPADATAMSAVAPLIGTTPRTVKRFINTYRLLKARATDLGSFTEPREGVGDHDVVSFLLAVATGQPSLAPVLTTLADGPPQTTVRSAIEAAPAPEAADPTVTTRSEVLEWLTAHPVLADVSAARCAAWASEVRRFTFLGTAQPRHSSAAVGSTDAET